MALVMPIRFSRPWSLRGQAGNPLDLRGKGELRIEEEAVLLRGHEMHLLFPGDRLQWRAALADIFDVAIDGDCLRFSVLRSDGGMDPVRLWAADAAAARRIAQALPQQLSHATATTLRAQQAFRSQLALSGSAVPRVTQVLLGLNLLVFVGTLAAGAGLFDSNPMVLLEWGSNFGPLTRDGQWWRLLTSLFLHFGLLHIAFNMWALQSGGPLVERLYGPWRYLLIYLAAGIAGGLASAFWHAEANSAGASAAIFGIYAAWFAFFMRRGKGLPPALARQQQRSGLLMLGLNLALGASIPGIDNAAHVGGLLTGLLLGWVLAPPLRQQPA